MPHHKTTKIRKLLTKSDVHRASLVSTDIAVNLTEQGGSKLIWSFTTGCTVEYNVKDSTLTTLSKPKDSDAAEASEKVFSIDMEKPQAAKIPHASDQPQSDTSDESFQENGIASFNLSKDTKSKWLVNAARASVMKALKTVRSKRPQRIDFERINWSDKKNLYDDSGCSCECESTIFPDEVLEGWSADKVVIPFFMASEIENTEFGDAFEPLDFEYESDANYVPPIFKFFGYARHHHSIMDFLKAKAKGGIED